MPTWLASEHMSQSEKKHPSAIGGRHRQRGTLRLLDYWAAIALFGDDRVFFAGMISDEVGLVASLNKTVTFDRFAMSADEAARAAIGQFIDDNELGPGTPPDSAIGRRGTR